MNPFNRVGSKDLLAFTSQLGVMAKAGIGLTNALGSIAEQIANPRMATVVQTLKRDVESGRQFSEAPPEVPEDLLACSTSTWSAPANSPARSATCSTASATT